MKQRDCALIAIALSLMLPACGGADRALGPSGIAAPALSAQLKRSTTITADFRSNGKPIKGLLITLSRHDVRGPVIAKGLTDIVGKVKLSGFTETEIVCAWGVLKRDGRESRTEDCRKPFPAKATLRF